MNEREKLIKQIEKAIGNVTFFKSDMEAIVNFILADRKRIIEPLIECNNSLDINEDIPMFAYRYAEAIGKTIKRANGCE